MAANFYNASGVMIGLDFHSYWAVPGVLSPLWPHVVGAPFSWLISDKATRLAKVTSNGKPMCQATMDLDGVPHVPLPIVPPHVAEAVQLGGVVIGSGSKAVLAVASVTGQGKPLAVCVEGAFGLNLNCQEGWKLPTGIVLQSNSVMTQPTAGDYACAVLDVLLDNLLSKVSSHLSKKLAGKMKLSKGKDALKEMIKQAIKELRKKHEKSVKDILRSLV